MSKGQFAPMATRLEKALETARYAILGMAALGHDEAIKNFIARKEWIARRLHETKDSSYAASITCDWLQGFRGNLYFEGHKFAYK